MSQQTGTDAMVALTPDNGTSSSLQWRFMALGQVGLRVVGAVLQILATAELVRVLPPALAGVYFRGFVLTFGLAALLRGKYELFLSQCYLEQPREVTHTRAVLQALGIRILVRSAVACAALLVITTDLDLTYPQLRPYLSTYLPFVLAVPFAALALFLVTALRGANYTARSVVVSSYGFNIAILAAAKMAATEEETTLVVLSWGFFAGSVLAAVLGVMCVRNTFDEPRSRRGTALDPGRWREICVCASRSALTSTTLACLQWGPLCVLAALGSEVQIADYAVVARTAQIIDFLLPAAFLASHSFHLKSRLSRETQSSRSKLVGDILASLSMTTLCLIAVALLTPWLIGLYGNEYRGLPGLFVLLYVAQWVAGTGRPVILRLAAAAESRQTRGALLVTLIGTIAVTVFGVSSFGALAAAAAVLCGALFLNAKAMQLAFRGV